MHSGDLSNLPNPFAPSQTSRWNGKRLISATKVLAIAIVAFIVLLVVTSRGPDWFASRLSQGFSSLDADQKQSRLVQLSQLGTAGIEPMMAGLADSDPEVADKTISLIRDLQTRWTTLPRSEADQNQLVLVAAIGNSMSDFPPSQQEWAAELLNHSIVENADRTDSTSRQIFNAANQALAQLTPTDQLADSQEAQYQSVAMKLPSIAQPLPVPIADGDASWTDWPPQRPRIVQAGFANQETSTIETTTADENPSAFSLPDQDIVQAAAYTASASTPAKSPPVVAQASLSVPTVPDANEQESTYQVNAQPAIQPASSDIDTASIIKMLGSAQETVRQQAATLLRQRGFSEMELSVANAIADSDPAYRIELIRQLIAQQTIDSRPWLLLLLRDDDREVKLAAVAALDRMFDPQIRKELRLRLIDETDQKVVLRIRRVLGLSTIDR